MIVLLFAAALIAFVVSAVSGGGAGLVLVPLLRAVVPIAGVPAALSIGTAASAVSRLAAFRASVRWAVVARFVPAALPAAGVGAWLLSRAEPAYAELAIGCFLLANLPALFRRTDVERPGRALGFGAVPAIGAAAGLLSGFTGAVGLLFNGFYRRLGLSRHETVATRAANEVLIHLLKIILYGWFGLLTGPVLAAGLLVAAAAVMASIATRWVLPRIDEAWFRRIGHVAMVASGAAMFALSSTQIARLHRAWVEHVAPDGEHELQFYWKGTRVIALEWEREGFPAVERAVPFARLTPAERAAALTLAPRRAILLVERVYAPGNRSHLEVRWRGAGGIVDSEVPV